MLDLIPLFRRNTGSGSDHQPEESQLTITEILSKIISFLSLSDRKSARLVCRNWYKAASHHSILRTEKLVCVNDYNRKQVFNTLSRSTVGWPHVQFRGLLIDHVSTRLWKKNGNQIHSLDFVSCRFSTKATRSIIKHCGCMKNLKLKNCSGFFSCDVFDYCTKKAIKRNSLKSIKIEKDADLSDYVFKRIFEVFPKVESIAVSLVNDRSYGAAHRDVYFEEVTKSETPVYESHSIFSHLAVYEKLKISADLIRDFKYIEEDRDVSNMRNNFFDAVHHIPDLKLRSLFFSPSSFSPPSLNTLSAFFAVQTKLEQLVLERSHFDNQCCSVILDSCVNLRVLELVDLYHDEDGVNYGPITLSQDIVEKLVKSKLESLKLRFNFRFEDSDVVPAIENNTTLRTLSINNYFIPKRIISMLMEGLQALKCLDLSNCNLDETLMQTILKFQTRLETLVLSFNKNLTDFALTGKPLRLEHYMTAKDTFSISGLTRLRILNLRDCPQITVRSLREMTLPELRYLSLQNCRKISFDGFQVLAKNCPSLEFFDVSHTTISPESVIKLSRQLDRLLFLDIAFCAIDELSMQVLLGFNNSLRFVRHTSDQYCFNIFKKQWKSTKTIIRLDVNGDKIKKCYGFVSTPPFSSKIFNCW